MKLITKPKEFEKEFSRLLEKHNEFFWSVAWASSGKLHDELVLQKHKIKKLIVGTHFYQTHPDFIESFIGNKNVKFIEQPNGTFHPKVYLFQNNMQEWEILIGSGNFTCAAFTVNTEANILISNRDTNSDTTYKKVMNFIDSSWNNAKIFKKDDLMNYKTVWENQRAKIKSLSGSYNAQTRNQTPISQIPIMRTSWEEFIKAVQKEKGHEATLNQRLNVIDFAYECFNKYTHFSEMNEDERKFIGGMQNKVDYKDTDWGFFGSMNGAGTFKNKIIANDINISNALDQIPLRGQITRQHYDRYVYHFQKAFIGTYRENSKNIATATRLLCLKRPDVFICLNSENKSKLCKEFKIKQSNMDFDRYWEDIILRIFDCEWYINPKSKNFKEEKISNARAAFLDSICYSGRYL